MALLVMKTEKDTNDLRKDLGMRRVSTKAN